MAHRDFLGNELAIDDAVVTTPKGYRGLVKGVVVAFTAQQVRVKYTNTWNYGQPGKEELFLTYGNSIVKI